MPDVDKRSAYIEESGLFFEELGLTRMAGRILGLLIVTDKEMVSFDDIREALKASKSSISTNLKSLVRVMFVKPLSLPGDRKTYYALSSDLSWSELIRQKMKTMDYMVNLFEKGLHLRTNQDDRPSEWIKDAIEFYTWMGREFPDLIDRWEAQKQKRQD